MTDPDTIPRPGAASVAARADCTGERHELVLAGGELQAVAHEDPDGERALMALGGTSCLCVELLDAWARRRADGRLLTLLGRGPSDLIAATGAASGWTGYAPLQRGRRPAAGLTFSRPARVVQRGAMAYASQVTVQPAAPPGPTGDGLAEDARLLAGLGRVMAAGMVGAVTTALLGRLDEPHVAAMLDASLYGRVLEVVRLWAGTDGADRLELAVVEPGQETLEWEPPAPDASTDKLQLALPHSWVAEVWAHDLALVGGLLVLARRQEDGVEALDAAAPPGSGRPRPRSLRVQVRWAESSGDGGSSRG